MGMREMSKIALLGGGIESSGPGWDAHCPLRGRLGGLAAHPQECHRCTQPFKYKSISQVMFFYKLVKF